MHGLNGKEDWAMNPIILDVNLLSISFCSIDFRCVHMSFAEVALFLFSFGKVV